MIPRVDLFEGSTPTRPADVLVGDYVAVSGTEAHRIVSVLPTPSGAYIDLMTPGGGVVYTIHRVSNLPIVKAGELLDNSYPKE